MTRTNRVKSGCALRETEQIGCRASCPKCLLSFCISVWVQEERTGFLSNCSNSFLAVPGGLVSSSYSFSFSHFPQPSAHPPYWLPFWLLLHMPPALLVLWPLLCMHFSKRHSLIYSSPLWVPQTSSGDQRAAFLTTWKLVFVHLVVWCQLHLGLTKRMCSPACFLLLLMSH